MLTHHDEVRKEARRGEGGRGKLVVVRQLSSLNCDGGATLRSLVSFSQP